MNCMLQSSKFNSKGNSSKTDHLIVMDKKDFASRKQADNFYDVV